MKKKSFSNLVKIIDELREKCPWDKKQTKDSLRSLTLEECYELSEAILSNDTESIKNELGDILTHIIFYSRLYAEKNQFSKLPGFKTLCRNQGFWDFPEISRDFWDSAK